MNVDFIENPDFESPDDEFYFLLSEIEPTPDEEPEYYCIQSDYVQCQIGDNKFKVHIRCWPHFDYRGVLVRQYVNKTSHLIIQAPYEECVHCRLNIHYIDLANNCDTCLLLRNA